MFSFHYLNNAPLIDVAKHVQLDGNANGPALVTAPDWLDNPPGKYLLYFAHHEGRSIRLATSENLTGPWKILSSTPMDLAQSHFATSSPTDGELHPEARAYIAADADGNYPHIASPDIWVDHENRQIRLYYHGRMANGLQRSRVALSDDGINFEAQHEILGLAYLRIFKHQDWFYALTMPGQLYRSRDGLSGFELGPKLTAEPIRHHALLHHHKQWYIFWTRVGDAPERILVSKLDTLADWSQWKLGEATEVHRPLRPWEGAELPNEASRYGGIMHRVNQLRDPAVFEENGRIYLLYSVAGEQGIAIGEIKA
jgi:hypothetical protein